MLCLVEDVDADGLVDALILDDVLVLDDVLCLAGALCLAEALDLADPPEVKAEEPFCRALPPRLAEDMIK